MEPEVCFYRFCGHVAPGLLPFQAAGVRLPALRAHSFLRSLKNSPSGHPQITQGKQRDQLRRVLGQSFVANLGKAELALDDPERVFQLGTDSGLELLSLVEQVGLAPFPRTV